MSGITSLITNRLRAAGINLQTRYPYNYVTGGMSYSNVLFLVELDALETRWSNISRSFFQDICKPNSCLYRLIAPACDTSDTTRLRSTTPFQRPNLHTQKYCSFINFSLHHHQSRKWLIAIPLHTYLLQNFLCILFVLALFVCLFIIVVFIWYLTAVFECYPAPGPQGCQ